MLNVAGEEHSGYLQSPAALPQRAQPQGPGVLLACQAQAAAPVLLLKLQARLEQAAAPALLLKLPLLLMECWPCWPRGEAS
jgi:hypothetical protein